MPGTTAGVIESLNFDEEEILKHKCHKLLIKSKALNKQTFSLINRAAN